MLGFTDRGVIVYHDRGGIAIGTGGGLSTETKLKEQRTMNSGLSSFSAF